jgi:MFS family permease
MNIVSLGLWRFFVGMSFGLGQPPWNVLSAEVTPGKFRTLINGLSQSLFCFGEIYSAVLLMLDDPSLQHLHWRALLRFGAIPSLVFLVAAMAFLQQSPHYLAQIGESEQARAVLKRMQRENCLPEFSVNFEATTRLSDPEQGFFKQISEICNCGLLVWSTGILMLTCFTLNFCSYGALYAFPNVLPHLKGFEKGSGSSAAFQLLLGALWEIPGLIIGMLAGSYLPRKPVLKAYLLFTCSMFILFTAAAASGSEMWFPVTLCHIGYFGSKLTVAAGFIEPTSMSARPTRQMFAPQEPRSALQQDGLQRCSRLSFMKGSHKYQAHSAHSSIQLLAFAS